MPLSKSKLKKLSKAIDTTMAKLLHEVGDEFFAECQKRCPEGSGRLKDSGSLKYLKKKGFQVRYEVPYAWDTHEGSEGNPGFTWKSTVRSHKRRLASGGTTRVRKHVKRYVGYKPTVHEDEWYMMNMNNPSDGRPWMDVSWDTIRSKQPAWLRSILPKKIEKIHEE